MKLNTLMLYLSEIYLIIREFIYKIFVKILHFALQSILNLYPIYTFR